MGKITEAALVQLNEIGFGVIPAFIILMYLLIKLYNSVFEAILRSKKSRIKILKSALKYKKISSKTKKYLEGELEDEYFRLSTGIRLNKSDRESFFSWLDDVKVNMTNEMKLLHFKRARKFIKFHGSEVSVDIPMLSKFEYWFNTLTGWGLILVSIFLILIAKFSFISAKTALIATILPLIFIFIGMFILALNFPVISAKRIKLYQDIKS